MINRVSAEITQQQVDTVLGAINTIKENLPFLINLTTQERAALPKMEDNRRPFVEKALEYAQSDEDMLPRYIDLEEDEHRVDGEWILDFNRAYNPTCAYSDRYECPLPPTENWLEVPIEAGEKAYH